MKRLICTTIATMLLAANVAYAGDGFLDGFAIGLSAAHTDVDVNQPDIKVNGETTGWRLFGAYEFNDKFSVEGGISSFGRPDDPTIASIPEVEAESYDVFAVGKLPLTEKLDVFGKAGFVSWTTEVEESELAEFSKKSTDLALGLGGEYDLTRRISIRGEYQWTDSKNTGAPETFSLAAVFQFK